jgi:hypothetical protein
VRQRRGGALRQAADFLGCGLHVDVDRLRALDPTVDLVAVRAALDGVHTVCAGAAATAGSGGAGAASALGAAGQPPRVRFGWLTAPRSTVVQPGPVHAGLTADPAADLERLLTRLVR